MRLVLLLVPKQEPVNEKKIFWTENRKPKTENGIKKPTAT